MPSKAKEAVETTDIAQDVAEETTTSVRGFTENAVILDEVSIVEEATETVSEEVEAIEVEAVEVDGNDVEFDNETLNEIVEPHSFVVDPKQLEDDERDGIPTFTDYEKHILREAMMLDTDAITMHSNIMKDMAGLIPEMEEEGADCLSEKNVYTSSRNILVEYRASYVDYMKLVNDNKDKILEKVNIKMDEVVSKYVKDTEESTGVTYIEGTMINYLINTSLGRALNDKNHPIVKFIKNPFDKDLFETIEKLASPIKFVLSSGTAYTSIDSMTHEERELLNIATSIVKYFKSKSDLMVIPAEDVVASNLGSQAILSISGIRGRKFYTNYMQHKRKYVSENKKFKKMKESKDVNLPLPNKLIKERFTMIVTESYLRKWISLTVYGDASILDINNKEGFAEAHAKYLEVNHLERDILSIVSAFSWYFLFSEIGNIIKYVTESYDRKLTSKDIENIKTYITLSVVTTKSLKLSESEYDISEKFSELVGSIRKILS